MRERGRGEARRFRRHHTAPLMRRSMSRSLVAGCHASHRSPAGGALTRSVLLWGICAWAIAGTVACSDSSETMRMWIGHQDSELMRVWGQPSEIVSEGDAGRTLVYTSYWLS